MGEMADLDFERYECMTPSERGRLRNRGIDFDPELEGEALVEEKHAPVPFGEHQAQMAAVLHERMRLQEELERARRLVGSGPFVVVKVPADWAARERGPHGEPMAVHVVFGGGVTRHAAPAVLELGLQALAVDIGGPKVYPVTKQDNGTLMVENEPAPGPNVGHGWVRPRADGAKARCGGPGLCPDCSREQALFRPAERPCRDSVTGLHRDPCVCP